MSETQIYPVLLVNGQTVDYVPNSLFFETGLQGKITFQVTERTLGAFIKCVPSHEPKIDVPYQDPAEQCTYPIKMSFQGGVELIIHFSEEITINFDRGAPEIYISISGHLKYW